MTAVLVATPLEERLAPCVAAVDDRVELLFDPTLLPPRRRIGDFSGDPGFRRDDEAERRWRAALGRAEVVYGIPGGSGRGLVDLLRAGPAVRWVQATNAGAGQQVGEALALDAGAVERVTVTTASGVHAGPLAEFALLGLLAFAKDLPTLEADKAARRWPAREEPIAELRGATLVLVGTGAIGVETARLARAFGMRVLGVKRDPDEPVPHVDEVHPVERLPELLGRADGIVVTLPGTEQTRGLIDAEALAGVKRGATFVNVGRGTVVDESALVERLRDGTLRGAALDVFATEPLPGDSPLWELDNVILSPHDTARVAAEEERVVDLFCENLRRWLDGAPLRNAVDLQRLY